MVLWMKIVYSNINKVQSVGMHTSGKTVRMFYSRNTSEQELELAEAPSCTAFQTVTVKKHT